MSTFKDFKKDVFGWIKLVDPHSTLKFIGKD